MRTAFTPEQLRDPHLARSERALRACVHCGFCTAACPTYVLLGDERDSPRGRIALIQQMLESDAPPARETVRHIDRCLSCLGCRTACPSGVDYAALIDVARVHIAENYERPWRERLFRAFVLNILMRPRLFAAATALARVFAPVAMRLPGRLGAMARKAPSRKPLLAAHLAVPDIPSPAQRIGLLPGCVQRVLAPEIDAAAARVLARQEVAVVPLAGAKCCGSLALHMGRADLAKKHARRTIVAFEKAIEAAPLDGVLSTATGCTAFLKDYPRLFAGDGQWQKRAAAFAAKLADFVELIETPPRPVRDFPLLDLAIAYHPPCSLQHGQAISGRGEKLLEAAGLRLAAFADTQFCCGSAGSYSMLQPAIAAQLRARKLAAIDAAGANLIVSGNAGCLAHLAGKGAPPALHIAELLDWAAGGPLPAALPRRFPRRQ